MKKKSMANKKTKAVVPPSETALADEAANRLFDEIRPLIEETRGRVASAVNAAMVSLYWHLGQKIYRELLGAQRAAYGKKILQTLSAKLVAVFGKGFSQRNLFDMSKLADFAQ